MSLVMLASLVTSCICTAEIGMFDGYVVVFKFTSDLHVYVTGGDDENEIILATVLQGFFDAISILLRLVCDMLRFTIFSLVTRLVGACHTIAEGFLVRPVGIKSTRKLCWRILTLSFCAWMRLPTAGEFGVDLILCCAGRQA